MHRFISAVSLVALLQGLQFVVQAQQMPVMQSFTQPTETTKPVAESLAQVVARLKDIEK